MNTSTEAIRLLEQANTSAREAAVVVENLIVEHDYQDVALLVTSAASSLLEAATLLMRSNDVEAIVALERADDYLDAVYDIIEADTEDES